MLTKAYLRFSTERRLGAWSRPRVWGYSVFEAALLYIVDSKERLEENRHFVLGAGISENGERLPCTFFGCEGVPLLGSLFGFIGFPEWAPLWVVLVSLCFLGCSTGPRAFGDKTPRFGSLHFSRAVFSARVSQAAFEIITAGSQGSPTV